MIIIIIINTGQRRVGAARARDVSAKRVKRVARTNLSLGQGKTESRANGRRRGGVVVEPEVPGAGVGRGAAGTPRNRANPSICARRSAVTEMFAARLRSNAILLIYNACNVGNRYDINLDNFGISRLESPPLALDVARRLGRTGVRRNREKFLQSFHSMLQKMDLLR